MTAKELLAKIKAAFDGVPAPAAPVAPAAPASPSVPAPVVYTLADGTQIGIAQAGTLPAVGDLVTIAGAPAPEGVLTLADGTLITTDATGAITQYTPVAPAAAAAPAAPAVPPAPAPAHVPAVPVTQAAMATVPAPAVKPAPVTEKQVSEMLSRFAVGDVEARIGNLELVAKALMQSEFGWQIMEQQRLADANAAIAIYQTTLQNQTAELEAAKASLSKHDTTIKGLFELVEKLVELPVSAPVTLTGIKKEKFEGAQAKEAALERVAAAIKKMKSGK